MNNKVVNKKITLLGSTGSIGRQTLEIAEYAGHKIFAIAGNEKVGLLELQARKYKPIYCAVYDEKRAGDLGIRLKDTGIKVLSGIDGLNFISSHENTDIVVNAMMGQIGLTPTLSAIGAKKDVALANKESLVTAGEIIMREARKNKTAIYPIDSEHSAIMQCIAGENKNYIKRLILTASGGPFYGIKDKNRFAEITKADALKHPTWSMGEKITIDSATMMNKGLEIIEAFHLYSVGLENINVLIHKQSIVHSMVEFCDNSVKAQLAVPDMRMSILYAIEGGRRKRGLSGELDLISVGQLTFEKPDNENFPLMEFARKTAGEGGIKCAVMNTANEIAVGKFLNGKIKFNEIADFVINATLKHNNIDTSRKTELEDINSAINEVYGRYM